MSKKASLSLSIECPDCGYEQMVTLPATDTHKIVAVTRPCDGCDTALTLPQVFISYKTTKGGENE